jgi:hypothetical protein
MERAAGGWFLSTVSHGRATTAQRDIHMRRIAVTAFGVNDSDVRNGAVNGTGLLLDTTAGWKKRRILFSD